MHPTGRSAWFATPHCGHSSLEPLSAHLGCAVVHEQKRACESSLVMTFRFYLARSLAIRKNWLV